MKIKNLLLCLFIIINSLVSIGICLVSTNETIIVVSSMIVSVNVLIVSIYITKDIFNVVNLFIVFMIMYGLSGPIEVINSGHIGGIFSSDYRLVPYIIIYNMCISGLVVGIVMSYKKLTKNKIDINIKNSDLLITIKISILMSILTTFMVIFDFIRVGGLDTLLQGRAIYMQAISKLPFTMPTDDMAKIAFTLFISSISIARNRGLKLNYKLTSLKIFIILMPYIIILIISGSRMSLVTFIFIGIVGYSYLNPTIKIKRRYIVCILVGYLFMGFIYINRGFIPHAISSGDWRKVIENTTNKDSIMEGLMPTSNEFSVGFGNFNEYYISDNKQLRFGESYIKDMNVMIPGFLYPGEKQNTLTYEFRDKFFYEESKRSSIAGTGFSAMLEAYINFGYLGAPIIYIIFGFIIGKLELIRRRFNSYTYMITYLIIIQSITMTFHRTQLANIVSEIVYSIIFIFIYKILFATIKNFNSKNFKIDECKI